MVAAKAKIRALLNQSTIAVGTGIERYFRQCSNVDGQNQFVEIEQQKCITPSSYATGVIDNL